MTQQHLTATELTSLRRKLKSWYARHKRSLPWRETKDPYHIWVSEIMLQQTTVAAVVPYFERFLNRFPTVADLANSHEEEVLSLWEGLGYYSRARNLRKAAQVIVAQHDGEFPRQPEALAELPGIGRYTAGAIASFAFERRAPIVEANTQRLYARLIGLTDDLKSTASQRQLWEFAELILPQKQVGDFNQALMELGSQVCTPQQPHCDSCPINACCTAFREGRQHEIPKATTKTKITEIVEAFVVVEKQSKLVLRKRTADERWAGMWDFPRYELPQVAPDSVEHLLKRNTSQATLFDTEALAAHQLNQLHNQLTEQLGFTINPVQFLTAFKHSVTRYRITLLCFQARWNSGRIKKTSGEIRWAKLEELKDLPLSVTARKLANEITKR